MAHKITSKVYETVFGEGKDIEIAFDEFGLVSTRMPNCLSYLADQRYLEELNQNENVVAVLTTEELQNVIDRRIDIAISKDPTYTFWKLFNYFAKRDYKESPSRIDESACIHPTTFVSNINVSIGANTIIEPNVTIHPDTVIGENCLIRSGTVCGFDGFEQKRTSRGIVSVFHDGKVIIKNNVEIGSLNSIAKGMMGRDTVIGEGTKTDSLVHIAHRVQIGKECIITASAEISGSVTIGDRCWLGPNCSVINGIMIGEEAFIGIGAVVTKPVSAKTVVAGNPAKILHRNV